MTDTTTAAPSAGWYADPSRAAAFRWWDGAHWTEQTRDAAPAAPASPAVRTEIPASAEVAEHAAAERAAAQQDAAQAPVQQAPVQQAPAVQAAPQAPAQTAAPQSTPRPASAPLPSRRSLRNLGTVPAGTPPIGPVVPVATPYVPLNPLAADPATPSAYHAPASPDTAWHTPEAWIANAPPAAEHAVYGTGRPFGAPQKLGRQPENGPARLAIWFVFLGFALNITMYSLLRSQVIDLSSALVPVAGARLLAASLIVAGLPLAIVGLVRASGMKRVGHKPKGRSAAVIALIASSLFTVLLGSVFAIGFADGFRDGLANSALNPQASAGSAQPAGGFAASGAPTPIMAVPQPDGTLAYSQAAADKALVAAVNGSRDLGAKASCPASVTGISVGTTFTCSVRTSLADTTMVAHVSILDATGRATVAIALK